MDGTILGQGSFLASYALGNPNPGSASNQAADAHLIMVPSGVDWLSVRNFSKSSDVGLNTVYFQGTANAFAGIEFYWQRGMSPGFAFVKYYSNAGQAIEGDVLVSGGFTLYDPSGQDVAALPLIGPARPTTATTNATQPVVSASNTDGLTVGSVVRMNSTAQGDVNGIDMVVSAVSAGASFTLLFSSNALANVPGIVGGAGFYRIINVDDLFYPRHRYVTDIAVSALDITHATVSTSVAHGLTVGQEVRFNIPAVSGMVELNGTSQNNYQAAIIVAVIDDYSFDVNIDVSGFTAFSWPTAAQQPSSFPIVVPVGEDTATSLISPVAQTPSVNGQQIFNTNSGLLADSTVNTGFLGVLLGSGGAGNALGTPISGPAGTVHFSAADVIDAVDQMYWLAGKSTYGGL